MNFSIKSKHNFSVALSRLVRTLIHTYLQLVIRYLNVNFSGYSGRSLESRPPTFTLISTHSCFSLWVCELWKTLGSNHGWRRICRILTFWHFWRLFSGWELNKSWKCFESRRRCNYTSRVKTACRTSADRSPTLSSLSCRSLTWFIHSHLRFSEP